jgi:aspartate aminotransferase
VNRVLSERIGKVKPSPTLAVDAKAKAMKAAGVNLISFGAGEPDFDTPDNIKEAAIRAIREGFTRYTDVGGIEDLKEAIIKKFKEDNKLTYSRDEVVVNCGGKHSFYNLAQVLFQKGDEVIIPAPYWVSYPPMVMLADAEPVILETSEKNGFKVTPEALLKALTPRTKALVLNSPSNPTGAMYDPADLKEIAQIAVEKDFFVISDDIYEKIVFDGRSFISIAAFNQKIKERTLVLNGVSKTYAMTGWRIGYMAGPADIIKSVAKLQSQSTSNPTSIAQKAALEALNGPQDFVAMMCEEFEKRRNYMVARLNALEGITCYKPQGAFYVFPNVSAYYGKSYKGKIIRDSNSLTEFLLEEAKVAVVPGGGFGADDYIRLSFAASMEDIREGLDRIERGIQLLEG